MSKSNDLATVGADKALALEGQFADKLQELKSVQAQIDDAWDAVKDAMVKHNVKSLKGDFGSITLAERTSFKTDDKLPGEYYKKAPDVKKIGTYYALTNELPEGVTATTTVFLTRRLK